MVEKKLGKRAQMVAEAVARLNAAGIPAVVSPAGDAVLACGISVRAPGSRAGFGWVTPRGTSRSTPEAALAADVAETGAKAAGDAEAHRATEARSRARAEALEKCATEHGQMAAMLSALPGGSAP
jgi:hypothetical protein